MKEEEKVEEKKKKRSDRGCDPVLLIITLYNNDRIYSV